MPDIPRFTRLIISMRYANDRERKNSPNTWIDPNDAPELIDEDFGHGIWASGDKVVSREKAQEAI